VVLVCSDGLHGPVSDDEIKQILLEEPDARKACDRLIACANAHDGPDNITVVISRFDGPGLPEPGADKQVSFLPYDPGLDPEDPEPERRPLSTDLTTGQTSPGEELRSTVSDVTVTEESTANNSLPAAQAASSPAQPIPEARPLLAFVLVTLLAALAGGLFLVSQRGKIPDRSFEKAGLASHRRVAPPPAATPSAVRSEMLGAPEQPADAGREP
jgi:hypothetical protein